MYFDQDQARGKRKNQEKIKEIYTLPPPKSQKIKNKTKNTPTSS